MWLIVEQFPIKPDGEMLPWCYEILAEAINNPGSLIMKISTSLVNMFLNCKNAYPDAFSCNKHKDYVVEFIELLPISILTTNKRNWKIQFERIPSKISKKDKEKDKTHTKEFYFHITTHWWKTAKTIWWKYASLIASFWEFLYEIYFSVDWAHLPFSSLKNVSLPIFTGFFYIFSLASFLILLSRRFILFHEKTLIDKKLIYNFSWQHKT